MGKPLTVEGFLNLIFPIKVASLGLLQFWTNPYLNYTSIILPKCSICGIFASTFAQEIVHIICEV
jgi:hypothetical protein